MKIFLGSFITLFIFSCVNRESTPFGHWHEIINGETKHCYFISVTIVSVDKFTYGYSRKVVNQNIYDAMITNSSFELLKDCKTKYDHVKIGDSILWIKMKDDLKVFLSDLSTGLLLEVEPPELNGENYDFASAKVTKLYIGYLKTQNKAGLENRKLYIQFDDAIGPPTDITKFFISHNGGNENRIAIIHADKNTPRALIEIVIEGIIKTGYLKRNIYRTVINKHEMTIGLAPF